MVAARAGLWRGQGAHGQHLGIDTSVLSWAHWFSTAKAWWQGQRSVDADHRVFGADEQCRNQGRVVERCLFRLWAELGYGDPIARSFEDGQRGVLPLAATQIHPNEAREVFFHG